MKTSSFFRPSALMLALLLGGCGVYAPLTPPTPLLTVAKPIEIAAAITTIGPCASVAIAPRPHLILLVRGSLYSEQQPYEAYSTRISAGASGQVKVEYYSFYQQQAELAAGYHSAALIAGQPYYGFLSGVGRAHVRRTYYEEGPAGNVFGFATGTRQFDVREYTHEYFTAFVQGQLTFSSTKLLYGPVVRYTRLFSQQLSARYAHPAAAPVLPNVPPRSFLEPAFLLAARLSAHLSANLKAGLAVTLPDRAPNDGRLGDSFVVGDVGISLLVGRWRNRLGGGQVTAP